jgi:hypothetical protein
MHNVEDRIPESSSAADRAARKLYAPPRLVCLGDVRDLTLGGSPGSGDSGNPGIQQTSDSAEYYY